ncbi:heavy metal translocating P-type ATPase [Paracoccus denitrificans]|jgi:Cu2+-exporting ATPase|uniref:Heavy metal translocating P-type ATPase n=1 Tax=Paracoccus denitrificans (strain Pd 1222) TaxID=318586 RepID=A1B345_PARDP|nr:heavy metal translocating P-type ATPase [Paracoccus denitrificans]ABL69939.1 heavy metal translocating P-type ATPase [Paracoccus denitrificans PD1222]MBB4627019.1 Cu2+-exporting ATPase [Paracoccus denitrificans]MCU7428405.1 heavy metal translocating P-type ATPase [Paracoccus denitrificans]QAR25325.1 cadmium-translocating P-type ATPase [Paracoccus denitrificans]UPV94210.1 cadmium-translocating P-type ATPase [Paracoccus denitrificans]
MSDATLHDHDARLSACPACDAAPLASRIAGTRGVQEDIVLSLPTIHCATCITDVERVLQRHPGVRDARVNLTLRRVTVDAPGMTAEELIPVVESIGYEAHELDPAALSASAADRQGRDILMRIGVSGFAMMNIMILSVAVWSGAEDATRDMFHWISGAIALPTVAFAGQPFFSSAWRALRHGRLGMDVPISLALILASAISVYETLHSGHHAYFDAAVMLCFFLLIGRYLDYRTRAVARSAAEELTALEVPRAFRVTPAGDEPVPVAELVPGDLIRIRPGARVPADGEIAEGSSEIDRSLLTGESIPVAAGPGLALSAGEVNLTGPLVMRVTAAGRDSSLARLTALVAAAESARGHYTGLADRASRLYSPLVHLLAFCSFLGWYLGTHDLRLAVNVAAAVLIITCPCALGLAVPAVVTAASGRLFRRGMLIKDGTALERLAEVDAAVFDKTGTLTMGVPQLVSLDPIPTDARPVALALSQGSGHPLSQALAQALRETGTEPAALQDLREVPGHGISGVWQGREVRLGRADWLGARHGEATLSASWLSLGQGAPIRLEFSDRLRPGAEACVARIVASGRRVMLLSGDAAPVVQDLARRLGIEEWRAGVTPVEKAEALRRLRQEGLHPLMVGDGLNDTAALTEAHVSISPASALDAARTASDMVLMGSDLAPVAEALELARSARARIKENFAISLVYNIVAVPIAIAGFATPLMAALAMSLSSISVTLNALRLR